ncbi:restriction endonuclease subunit S [Anoxybacillus sp. ST4]|uniref:restriction endonuclease subunit S n=1 Tax=Anoxybacillus sp. ST4 TaxID=2864181 RepID=UPI001C63E862|nr:restriction endonuclease subunit S [Anoxybacillus sp. ST4]MBW7651707.1 restriction endonuclease subunit S [Anoxybacillus sp. ST4]
MSKTKQKPIDELLKEALVPEDEQPYQVPENWVWVRLKSINKNEKRNIDPRDYGEEIFELYSVPSYDLDEPEYVKGKEIGSNKQLVQENEILLCKINPRINRVWIVSNSKGKYRQLASTEWIVVSKSQVIYPKYLLFLLKSPYFRKLITSNVSGVGGSLTRAKPKDVEMYPIAVPPLNEQKRIVDKIERLFAKIDEAKRLIEEVKESVELRRAAILDRAIRGELVKQSSLDDSADILLEYIKMKRDFLVKQKKIHKEKNLPILGLDELRHNIPENWIWVRLGEVIELISGRDVSVKECNNDGVGVPYIMGASNIMDDTLIIERWITKPSVVGKKGDILLSVKGTVGKVVIQEVEECHLSRQIMGLRPMEGVYGRYLKIFIQTYVQVLKEKSKGVIPGISREDILLAPFPLPPYNEQKRIAEKVDFLLSNLDREKEMVLEVEEKLDLLKQSILSQAFRGELGTNDPNDEHAIELLKEVLKSK